MRVLFLTLFWVFVHLCSWAQIGGDYNPDNPSDPGTPLLKYTLTLKATPTEGGSFNTSSTKVAAGERYNLRAYPHTDFVFIAWLCNGDTLSKSASYDYTMPSHSVDITGVFAYNPESPADPTEQPLRYQLSLIARPVNSGSFNISNERLAVGSNNRLRAYPSIDYVFRNWTIGDSVLSTNPELDFVMPSHQVQIIGHFEYNPASPADPNANYWNKQNGEVIVDHFTPGDLSHAISSVISGSNSNEVLMITVAGKINDNDFGIANQYSKCYVLDFSRVTGVTEVPSYAFDYSNLETVYLPATIEKMGARAFAECSNLKAIVLYAMTPPTLEDNVFQNIPEGLIVYIPAAAIPQYQKEEGWGKFTLLPIQEDIRNISISLPQGTNAKDYAQMWLELTNKKSGQRVHYVMTDRQTYTFGNIIRNTTWSVTLRNERGDVFGEIDNVEVKDKDVNVTFATLSKPQEVTVAVLAENGTNVTDQVQITWTDAQGNYRAQGASLSGFPAGYQTHYRITLSEALAMQYNTPAAADYTLKEGENAITCQLQPLKRLQLSGKVKDATTGVTLHGAIVSTSQTFGGKYSKTLSTQTNANGVFSMEVYNVPSSVAIAAENYLSQTLDYSNQEFEGHTAVALPDIALKSITGATISMDFTYTTVEGEKQNGYDDYQNIDYTLLNVTKNRPITQYNVQYPQIVLLESVDEGDILRLKATSRTKAFNPVETTTTIADQKASATFALTQLGRIDATFSKTGNAIVVGSLYDASNKLVKTYNYSDAQLTISDLADGNYTLVSMGSSLLFNTIFDLAQLPQTGLVKGTDYVQNAVEVKSGAISTVNIDEVPKLDESKLYYTGGNTSFTVNKPSIVAGNYLTLTGHIDFKSAYVTQVSNVQMIVDLPESCQFVENSVMVGNSTSSYTMQGHQLIIPMSRHTDRVRFCVIPTLGGEYAPSAFAQFDLNGKTVKQPIGAANFTTKNLSITVPSLTAASNIPISGTAPRKSNIGIYDGNILIGQTKALANGIWSLTCELNNPEPLSEHHIYGKVLTDSEMDLITENVSCTYDEDAIIVNRVKMINSTQILFDFQNPKVQPGTYSYNPAHPNFTFIADISAGKNYTMTAVTIYALTEKREWIPMKASYDSKKEAWIANKDFHSGNLPINVGIDYRYIVNGESFERIAKYISEVEAIESSEYQFDDIEYSINERGDTIIFSGNGQTENNMKLKMIVVSEKEINISYTQNNDNKNLRIAYSGENSIPETAEHFDLNGSTCLGVLLKSTNKSSECKLYYPIAFLDEMLLTTAAKKTDKFEFVQKLKEVAKGCKIACVSIDLSQNTDANKVECKDALDDALANCPELELIIDRMRRRNQHSKRMNRELNDFRKILDYADKATKGKPKKPNKPNKGYKSSSIKDFKSINAFNLATKTANLTIKCGQAEGNYINSLADRNDWASLEAAGCIPPNYPPNPPSPNSNGDAGYIMDPSGYVYEAVSTNRIEGVTATCFYKEMVEDMYGDLHENIVKWDAAEYAQENPLFTDENGMYAWDVPQGLWQVKFEKEGYETTYSDWLPVPPPQLEVNIAMKQNRQPEVKTARAYEDAVEVEFDKYMMPEQLTAENIMVMQGNQPIAGSIELLDNEVAYEGSSESFASKIRFNAAQPFADQEVTLMVSNHVRSYAGIRMQDNYMQKFTIEQEIKQMVCDSLTSVNYGEKTTLTINVLPASAANGKKLYVKSSSPMILLVETEQVLIDEQGKAEITISGELPGTAALTFSIEGTDKTAQTLVQVKQKGHSNVAVPTANIASGTVVEKGTKIELACATEGATIYYTLDGSCPCENTESRKVYDGTPIVINKTTTIKAIAITTDWAESEMAEFTYLVDGTGIEDVTILDDIRIYPLPVRNILNITAGGHIIERIVLSSTNGTIVASSNQAATKTTLDVSKIPAGIYIIHVTTKNGNFNRKLLKIS